jgi:hypothetical protein
MPFKINKLTGVFEYYETETTFVPAQFPMPNIDLDNYDLLNVGNINGLPYPSSGDLATTLGVGNSAGAYDIDMNNNDLLNTDKISFNTATTDVGGVGQLKWNNTDGTLDLGLKGGNVTLQIGQENVIRVHNFTSPPILLKETDYQAVIVTGAVGGKLAVKLAQANSEVNSFATIGVVTEDIGYDTEGFITTYGLVRNINTTGALQGETWADGDVLYLSPFVAGAITKVKPISPNSIITIGYVSFAHATSGSIFVKVDNLSLSSAATNEASTQWSRTLGAPVTLNNGSTANGFTFFSDATDRVAAGCTSYCEFFISFTRKLTLTGTSGTANINVGGVNYLATFTTSLTQTAINFVATHGATIESATGIKVAAVSGVIRFGFDTTASLDAITITNVTTNLSGTFDSSIGDHVLIPYVGTPYEGLRLSHLFRVNFNIVTGNVQTYALSLRRWIDDSIIGSEIPIARNADVSGVQETFVSYTAGVNDPFATGGFYFALRNDSGASLQIDGNVGVLIITSFQKPVNF